MKIVVFFWRSQHYNIAAKNTERLCQKIHTLKKEPVLQYLCFSAHVVCKQLGELLKLLVCWKWQISIIIYYLKKWNISLCAAFKNSLSNYRPLVLTTAVIGAKNDFTNGYLGCLRSLWLNGFKITIENMKTQLKGSLVLHVYYIILRKYALLDI